MLAKNFLVFISLCSHNSVDLHFRRVAANVPAALRRRGLHCRLDGRKTSKSAQTFGRVTASLAPNRPLAAGVFYISSIDKQQVSMLYFGKVVCFSRFTFSANAFTLYRPLLRLTSTANA